MATVSPAAPGAAHMGGMAHNQSRRPVKGRIPSAGGSPTADNASRTFEKHLGQATRLRVQTPGGRRRKKQIKTTETENLRALLRAVVGTLR